MIGPVVTQRTLIPTHTWFSVVYRVLRTQTFHHILSDYETTTLPPIVQIHLHSRPIHPSNPKVLTTILSIKHYCAFIFVNLTTYQNRMMFSFFILHSIVISIHENWRIFEYQTLLIQFLSFFSRRAILALLSSDLLRFSSFFLCWLNVPFVTSLIDILCILRRLCNSTTMLNLHGSSNPTMCPSLLIIALHYLATIRKLLVHFANRFCAGIGTTQMVLITILSVLLRKTNEDIYHSFQKAPHVDGTRDNSCDNTTHISYLHSDVRNLPCWILVHIRNSNTSDSKTPNDVQPW